jgi:glycosyltransferase involved in cell wall biosynthesis
VSRKKIVILIDWYLPGYKAGGPIQSVVNIVQRLKKDFDFAIITSNSDLSEEQPYSTVQSDIWTTAPDGTRTYYLSKPNLTYKKLKELLLNERADFIYINSLFSVYFTIIPLLIRKQILPYRKVILAPRGMLGEGSLKIKPTKKKLFLFTSKLIGLFKNITWQASTAMEEAEIKKAFSKTSKVITAVDLPTPQNLQFYPRIKEDNKCRLVFISRIATKKNLLPVFHALFSLKNSMEVILDIYGPIDEAEYWSQCEAVIRQAPANIKISYKGSVEYSKVAELFRQYHFSVLYTMHENFGHSIIEGMAAGCPAILSDQTPWRELQQLKAGWDLPLSNDEALQQTLTQCCEMKQSVYDEWSRGALTFASAVINDEKALMANRSLFQ